MTDQTAIETPDKGLKRSKWKILGTVGAALLLFGLGAIVGAGSEIDTTSLDQVNAEVERLGNDNEALSAGLDEVTAERDEVVEILAGVTGQSDEIAAEQARRTKDLDTRETELAELEQDLRDRETAIVGEEARIAAGTIPGDGIWTVGDEIEPGTYKSQGPGQTCYWARLSGLSGEFGDIITNDLGSAKTIVEISSSDVAFETTGCGEWVKQ